MMREPRTRSGEQGYSLLTVMLLVFGMFIIGSGFFSLVGYEVRSSQASLDSQRAFWLAEGGNERALRYLTTLHSPPTSDFFIFQDVPGANGGTYTVHCAVDTTDLWVDEKAFVLEGVGNSNGVERRVRQWVSMTSFAQYAMFTGEETFNGNPIWFVTGDVVEGRLHTNGTFHIAGSPVFRDRISSASDHMVANPRRNVYDMDDWPINGNNPTFGDGIDLGAERIPMPTELPDLKQQGMFDGVYTPVATDIELGVRGETAAVDAPGWLRYRAHGNATAEWISVEIATLEEGVFYSDGNVHIEGVLDGELTVASAQDIRIEDDILYEGSDSSGRPAADCDDLLGLVAEQNVIFVDNPANRNNLIVDAILMALNTSIMVENYRTGPPRGALTIWGGLIQKFRGPVGMFRSRVPIHGYSKDYHYDPRVTARIPPSFPQTGVYEKVAWEETWDVSNPF